ncbi:MAG: hypothetical protein U0795_00700 [Pirellulales bacterium]
MNLHADHLKVVGTDQLGVTVNPAGDLQVGSGVGLELKTTLAGTYTFTNPPSISADPSSGNHAVRKSYVDNLIYGLAWKDAVRAHASANITLSGLQTIDGVVLVANDRVLVSGQTTAAQDGIYLAASGAWTRTADCPVGETLGGITVHVREGTLHANKTYTVTNEGVVNTDGWSVALIAGGAIPIAGDGLEESGGTWLVNAADNSIDVSGSGIAVKLNVSGSGLEKSSGLRIDINGTTAETVADNADSILIYDATAAALRKMTRGNFLSGIASGSTKFAEYSIVAGDVTAKQATLTGVAGNVGANHLVFLNGLQLNASDATLNTGTGVLTWTGLSLDGRIAAGDKVQVWGHN